VTSLGANCEVAIFAELLFYPNVLGVTKWFFVLPLARTASSQRMDQVEMYLEVDPEVVSSFSVPALSLGGLHTWKYIYRFGGLTLD
jgi:hypothetical protein